MKFKLANKRESLKCKELFSGRSIFLSPLMEGCIEIGHRGQRSYHHIGVWRDFSKITDNIFSLPCTSYKSQNATLFDDQSLIVHPLKE